MGEMISSFDEAKFQKWRRDWSQADDSETRECYRQAWRNGFLEWDKADREKRLVMHADGSFSVRVLRGKKWKWEHGCRDIQVRDFKRLGATEMERLRALEAEQGMRIAQKPFRLTSFVSLRTQCRR